MARWLILFLAAGAGATLGDRGHIIYGVLSYPGGGQPGWVFPEMGLAALALVGSWLWFPGASQDGPAATRDAVVGSVWFMGAYGATSPLSQWPLLLTVGLLALFGLRAWHNKLSKPGLIYCLSVAIGGAAVEAVISNAGLFAYAQPQWGLVPMWLPMLYLHVALSTRAIGRAVF